MLEADLTTNRRLQQGSWRGVIIIQFLLTLNVAYFRMKNTPINEQECLQIVKKVIKDIDKDLVDSSEGEEGQEAFDLEFICSSIRKQAYQEVYTSAGIHRPMNPLKQVRKISEKAKKLTKGKKIVSLNKTNTLARSVQQSAKETSEKLISKASDGLKECPILEKDSEATFLLIFSNRSYTVDLTTVTPTCTCPRYKATNSTCKHVVMTLVLLGMENDDNKVLTAKKYTKHQRKLLDEKILAFKESNMAKNRENFQLSLLPKTSKPVEKLADITQHYFQEFKSYNDAMAYIKDPNNENVAATWAVTQAADNRRKCPALHEGDKSISKGSLVLAADYTTIMMKIDGSYTSKRSRRNFHAKEECINSVPKEMKRFTNLLPASSSTVDVCTLSQDTQEQIKGSLPTLTFS